MRKEKVHIEFMFDKAAINSLWNYISTPSGLSEWFADGVVMNENIYTFIWDNHPAEAEVAGIVPNSFIRFHWQDDENPNTFFELRLHRTELTGATMLEVTDFAEPGEKDDLIALWETQVKTLSRILGL